MKEMSKIFVPACPLGLFFSIVEDMIVTEIMYIVTLQSPRKLLTRF